ncbi:MAG TPA: hypothetical protein VD965_14045 [Burkholderiales bacterium]|nr:hypothetical protein [Burkholderiales bacterium]
MSATTVKLLNAAAEIVGGRDALARRLGIRETMLAAFMADRFELPDALVLKAVDIILGDGPAKTPAHDLPATQKPVQPR